MFGGNVVTADPIPRAPQRYKKGALLGQRLWHWHLLSWPLVLSPLVPAFLFLGVCNEAGFLPASAHLALLEVSCPRVLPLFR